MAITLALVEATAVFAAVYATLMLWARPLLADWTESAGLLAQATAFSLCYIVACYFSGLYDLRNLRRFSDLLARLTRCISILVIVMVPVSSSIPRTWMGMEPFAASLLNTIALLLVLRAAAYWALLRRSFSERVLIVGTGPLAQNLIQEMKARPRCPYAIVGVVDDGMAPGRPPFRYPILGPLEHLGKIIEEVHPDRITVALADQRGRLPVYRLIESLVDGVVVENGVEVYERLTGKLAIEALMPSNLIFSHDFRTSRLVSAFGRGISLLASVVGLAVLAPLFGIIALAIKLDSPGPVFFIQDRVGMMGRRFRLIKFRTMVPVQGPTSEWEKDNGDRITRVGKWLRKFRLDELPQFVNILRGDMNLVGPRPHPVSNLDLLVLVSRNVPERGESIPYYSLRSMVRPGITGWAQVRYRYANDIDEEIEKMRYDLYYIKHVSLWLDLRIILETVKIVLFGRGSSASAAHEPDAPEMMDFVEEPRGTQTGDVA